MGRKTIRQRALMHVFGQIFGSSIVEVIEHEWGYQVKFEAEHRGHYETAQFQRERYELQVEEAIRVLEWIGEGNEFPSTT